MTAAGCPSMSSCSAGVSIEIQRAIDSCNRAISFVTRAALGEIDRQPELPTLAHGHRS